MHIHWESRSWPGANIEQSITSLDWIPDQRTPLREGCGLLGVGCDNGSVGITSTDLGIDHDCCRRYNSNLRGHQVAVSHVSWNRSMNKLFSTDINGVIYLWVANEDRWTVELVNDRSFKIRDFHWSPNGQFALMCYEDNFVLIGTAIGQRIWANTFLTSVMCGCWSPDSQEIVLGFSSGLIHVINEQGALITENNIFQVGIKKLEFSPICPSTGRSILAVLSINNQIMLLGPSYEFELGCFQSPFPVQKISWSSDGAMLAVVCDLNKIFFLSSSGKPIHSFTVLSSQRPITAFTWAYDNQVIIVASGGRVSVGRVFRGIPLLSQLTSYRIWKQMGKNSKRVEELGIPKREYFSISKHDHHIIRCRLPSLSQLEELICEPSTWRWFCTIVTVGHRNSLLYKLCMEHLGGYISLLVGKQINRIVPHFIITYPTRLANYLSEYQAQYECGSTAQVEDVSTEMRRGESRPQSSVWRRSKRKIRRFMSRQVALRSTKSPPTLVQITSNVWCTRFKITAPGLKNIPNTLSRVNYKTSVLHLQPRQMSISLTDLTSKKTDDEESLQEANGPKKKSSATMHQKKSSSSVESPSFDPQIASTSIGVVAPLEQVPQNPSVVLSEEDEDTAGPSGLNFQAKEFLHDEKLLCENVFAEFKSVQEAMKTHMEKIKNLSNDLESNEKKPGKKANKKLHKTKSLLEVNSSISLNMKESNKDDSLWQERLDLLNFIDDDNPATVDVDQKILLLGNENESDIPVALIPSCSTSSQIQKPSRFIKNSRKNYTVQEQLEKLKEMLEQMSKLSAEISSQNSEFQSKQFRKGDALKLGNNSVGTKADNAVSEEMRNALDALILQTQLLKIARQFNDMMKLLKINCLLKEIHGNMRHRLECMNNILGNEIEFDDDVCYEADDDDDLEEERRHPNDSEKAKLLPYFKSSNKRANRRMAKKERDKTAKTLRMTNKTPFWNEQSQVYQLDFNGRVTQESAKNFQIDFQSRQVLQFGRIENGAYTLDFTKPFSAIQAFAIALASITQRLK